VADFQAAEYKIEREPTIKIFFDGVIEKGGKPRLLLI